MTSLIIPNVMIRVIRNMVHILHKTITFDDHAVTRLLYTRIMARLGYWIENVSSNTPHCEHSSQMYI